MKIRTRLNGSSNRNYLSRFWVIKRTLFYCTFILSLFSLSFVKVNEIKSPTNQTKSIEGLKLNATFTAPADMCIDATPIAHVLLGSPTGGVYSGPGVMNLGDGISFAFFPAQAGAGVHTITYSVSGCTPVSDQIEVFALPIVSFSANPTSIDINAGVQTGLSGGTPIGGVYSGPGVQDNGNGTTYTFDPMEAGGGEKILTYNFSDIKGCIGMDTSKVTVATAISVSFSAPADLCLNAGVQNGLGGATPTGGVYSGAGVTDGSDGLTYSFDPAIAGVGEHNLTYTVTIGENMGSASDIVEVFPLPSGVSFTAPGDMCIDSAISLHILLGTPDPGVYSGPGVNDLTTGSAFTFNPALAGAGVHTLNYSFTDAVTGCITIASDNIEVFALPIVTFTVNPSSVSIDAGIQNGLGGGSPIGGVYSGPGVVDDNNGETYSFNPAIAGVGSHGITYSFEGVNGCTGTATNQLMVTPTTVIWDGSESSNWNTSGNWDTNIVPTFNDDVIIPQVATNNPIIDTGISAKSKSVSITTNGDLIIKNNGMLSIANGSTPLNIHINGKLLVETGGILDVLN